MGIKVRHNGQWVEMGFAGAPGGEPVGTIIAWGGSAANIPSNFRLCDGQALSRTTYSELFSKLGTIHGSGDGSTTFNIPDLRNKFIVGANNSTGDTTYPDLSPGATGGSAYATLPSHNHGSGTLVAANHRHNFPGDDHLAFANGVAGWNTNTNGTFNMDADSSSSGNGKMWYTTYSGTLSVSGSTSTEGSSTLNANLPPYYALCYIIKIDTSSATGSGVADGDYGDITVSSSGTVWNIDPDTIGPTELIATGVSAGSYTNANISVDLDGRITSASSGSAPVTTFLGLSDTPSTYVPSAGKVLVVNNTQNGVEFVDKSAITSGFSTDKISEGNTEAEVVDTGSDGHFKVTTEGTERLRVTSDGFVGIGSAIPAGVLDINSTTGDANVYIRTFSNNLGNTQILFGDSDRNDSGKVQYNHPGDYMVFHTNSSEQVRITSDGNVGIGSTIPATKLDVFGNIKLSDTNPEIQFNTGGPRFRVPADNTLTIHSGGNSGTGDLERLRIGPNGEIGLGGAFYGSAGQILTSGGSGAGVTWSDASSIGAGATDKISEGDSKAEIIDTATESKFTVEIDAAEKFSVDIGGPKIHRQDNSNEGGSIVLNRAADDVAAFELDVYGSSSSDSGRFRIIDSTGGGERFTIGPAGQIGLSGAYYGSSGQVLTSNGSGSAPTWQNASGGGGSSDPVGTIVAWGGSASNIPSEYTLCNGASLSRTTYADLFAALGTVHGSGDGSTTFNIPDLRNQFIVGAKNGGNNNYPSVAVGATGGSADAVVVQHNHGITEPNSGQGHRHVYTAATSIGGHTDDGGSPDQRSTTKNNLNTNYSTTGITINNEGVSGTNANLPPYYALCYIIKHTATSGSGGGAAGDKISEGNTEAEVVDTGSDGHFKVTTEGTERLRITSNGSVGIGTTNPEGSQNSNPLFATKLDVFKSFVGGGDRSFVGRFYGLDTNVQETSVRFITKGTGGTTADLHNASDAYLMHGISNGNTKFVFGANGNVGIGSTIPREKIDISAGRIILDQDYQFTWANGTTNRVRIYGDSGDNFVVENGSSNTERLRVTSTGNVGIGTINPNNAVDSTNTAKLAVGIVTCHELYVNGTQITGSGSGGGGEPVGTIVAWSGTASNIPTGYQLCDGGAAQTSALQAITGANVPDLRSRFIVGANDVTGEGTWPSVGVGSTGGSANSVVASHSHGTYGNESGYRHPVRAGTDATLDWDSHTAHPNDATYNSNSRTDTAGVDADGNVNNTQSGTNANLPPYYALCYIIKHTATSGSGGSGGTTKVAILSDVKSSGTAGGNFASGSWIDRTLNTEVDPESFVTFSSSNNYFALESGTYKINWSAPAYNTGEHKTQLVHANNTSFTSPTNIQGTSEFDSSGIEPNTQTRSFGETVVTITETTYFKLQHRCAATQNSNGLGIESNFGVDEVYSQIVVQDLSSGGGSGSSSGGSGGTVSSGTFTATAGSPSTLESYTYDSAELVFEYTVFVKNGSNYQTQKLLVMRDGTTVDSSQYAVMYNSNLLVQLDATISGGNVNLRATPETGVSGSTTYRIKREVV